MVVFGQDSREEFLNYIASKRKSKWSIALIGTLFAILFISLTAHFRPTKPQHLEFPPIPGGAPVYPTSADKFVKPENVTIVGLVFYGRRNRVEMLRCYLEVRRSLPEIPVDPHNNLIVVADNYVLQRNMVDNGGWLDEIHWIINTVNEEDLAYLDEILASSDRYKTVDLSEEGIGFEGYEHAWGHLERGKLYVKIDDDIVWFADDAIPRIIDLKMKHPEYLLVSGNIINNPLMGWVHLHLGALHPYFPETEPPPGLHNDGVSRPTSWKASAYPFWEGPDDFKWDLEQDPPFVGHRWLRLENDSALHRTPAAEMEYKTWGTSLKSWAIAAQEHYSFLENLENDQLNLYKFGPVWKTDYERLSINFMTLWGEEVLDNLPMDTVDEEYLTKVLPERIGKSIAVDSHALAAHFTFGTQGGVESTDLLQRYHAYAIERACSRKV